MKVFAFLLAGLTVFAQAPDFSGTWKLDSSQSQITPGAGLSGLIRAGTPQTLHVTQPANGTLIIESQINESHSRMYRPGGKSTTPVGPTGTITMTTKWDGDVLISEGALEATAGSPTPVKEVFRLSPDGRRLTIEITVEKNVSTLVYARTQTVGTCQTWPTPCKPPVQRR
jgi:hypothetical protein